MADPTQDERDLRLLVLEEAARAAETVDRTYRDGMRRHGMSAYAAGRNEAAAKIRSLAGKCFADAIEIRSLQPGEAERIAEGWVDRGLTVELSPSLRAAARDRK